MKINLIEKTVLTINRFSFVGREHGLRRKKKKKASRKFTNQM